MTHIQSITDGEEMYTVKDIMKIMQFKKNKAYQLVNSEGFPQIKIDGEIRIPKVEFIKWRKSYMGKNFMTR